MSAIAVVGAGYVGLTTAAVLAHLGHQVCCADVFPAKVAALSRGEVSIAEQGLEDFVRQGIAAERLSFVLGVRAAAAGRGLVFVCVPTPQHPDGSADMSHVLDTVAEMAPVLDSGSVVVVKSTVPVGSAALVARALGRSDVAVVSNPEFLREGSALRDCLNPDRIVIGSTDRAAAERVASLYEGTQAPIMITDPATAEMTKYASNAFLATKISFVNSVANLCQAVGADAQQVLAGMGLDRRIGNEFLSPGPGWGGSCLPKDTKALLRVAEDAGFDFTLLAAAVAANEQQRALVVSKVMQMVGGSLAGETLAAWGLSFKAGTDDCRESPAIDIIARLTAAGATVRAYDPTVRGPMAGMEVCDDAYGACDGAAALVVLTEWDEFRWLDYQKVARSMSSAHVFDARNLLDPDALRLAGFTYQSIGRR